MSEKNPTDESSKVQPKKEKKMGRGRSLDMKDQENLAKKEEGVRLGISEQGMERAKSFQNLNDLEKKIVGSIETAMNKIAQTGGRNVTKNNHKGQVYFISGFDYFGLSPEKNDGLLQMSKTIPQSKHYFWNDQDKIVKDIKKQPPDVPIILVGHSLGGDSAVEIAKALNNIENHFRKIDLMVTLDSVGFKNEIIPENVAKNINFFGENDPLFNGGPNAARDNSKTEVVNYLRGEDHSDLDSSDEIQREIFDNIQKEMKKNLSKDVLDDENVRE